MGTAVLVFVFVAYILLARRDLGAARITRNFGVMIDEEGLALRGTRRGRSGAATQPHAPGPKPGWPA